MFNPYHHGDLRNALLARAGEVLEEKGPEGISLRSLARDLGVSHAAPAHHFGNRRGLLEELAADGFELLANALEASMEQHAPSQWLRAISEAYVAFGLGNPARYRLMFTSRITIGDHSDRLRLDSSRAYLALLTAVRQKAPIGDATNYVVAWPELRSWAIVHGLVMLRLDGEMDGLDDPTYHNLMIEVLAQSCGS